MRDVIRLIMAGLARWFLESQMTKTTSYFRASDLQIDDPVSIPDGKAISITIEYVKEEE